MSRIILRDGKVAELRPATKCDEDREMLRNLFGNASADSLYYRFFHAVKEVSRSTIEGMLEGNGPDGLSLLCLAGDRALGIGSYISTEEHCAEVSFFIDDEYHGRGLGTLLLEHLAEHAWRHGFKQFEAYVIPENHKMLQVFSASGYEIISQQHSDTIHLFLPLTHTERSIALQQTREKLAAAASLTPFFHPRTVAVIGASRNRDRLGHQLFRHVLESEYKGIVYPVNPGTSSVAAVRAYSRLTEVPDAIDLAVIIVPADQVMAVVDDCIDAQVKAVMITSAGFADAGPEGMEIQQEVVARLRSHGCRLIGPNCMGIITTSEDVQLNASFVQHMPAGKGISIASQSGALGIAILEYAEGIGVGVSHFVSMGNKADISGNDLLQYWEDDPDTDMILLYLESFGNPRKFTQIARRITRRKPILVVKGGRTPLAYSVSKAHNMSIGALEPMVDALFQQTGIIRLDTLPELFNVASLLSRSPLPQGRRVAIVTNTAGGAVITVDALQKEGMEFVGPVVDLGSEALAEGYRQVLPQVLRDPAVDAVVVLFVPIGVSEEAAVTAAIRDAILAASKEEDVSKPIVANFLANGNYAVRYIDAGGQRVPIYPFPEQGVRALAKVATYAEYRRTGPGRIPDLPNMDLERARALVREGARNQGGWLVASICADTLTAVGIPVLEDASAAPRISLRNSENSLTLRIELNSDPLFGPVLVLHRIVAVEVPPSPVVLISAQRIIPLTSVDARDMTETICRSLPREDEMIKMLAPLEDCLLRLSRLVDEVPEISQVIIPSLHLNRESFILTEASVRVETP